MEDFSPDTLPPLPSAPDPARDLGALIGSRICHDLNNPLGAIGNGLELMELSGHKASPELALIAQSVAHAKARVQYLRLAFGAASPGQQVAAAEVAGIVAAHFEAGRSTLHWPALGRLERAEAKLALLALMCLESALPFGGALTVTRTDGRWQMLAEAERLRDLTPLWDGVAGRAPLPEIGPPQVQFLLLPEAAARLDRALTVLAEPTRITLTF